MTSPRRTSSTPLYRRPSECPSHRSRPASDRRLPRPAPTAPIAPRLPAFGSSAPRPPRRGPHTTPTPPLESHVRADRPRPRRHTGGARPAAAPRSGQHGADRRRRGDRLRAAPDRRVRTARSARDDARLRARARAGRQAGQRLQRPGPPRTHGPPGCRRPVRRDGRPSARPGRRRAADRPAHRRHRDRRPAGPGPPGHRPHHGDRHRRPGRRPTHPALGRVQCPEGSPAARRRPWPTAATPTAATPTAAAAPLVTVAGRDPGRTRALAERHGVTAVTSIEEAVRAADAVLCCTAAREPVLDRAWLRSGAHVSSVGGSHGPEVDAATVRDATLFAEWEGAASSPPPAGAHELRGIAPARVTLLGAVLAGSHPGRRDASELTLFKSTGHAALDVAAARVVRDATTPAEPLGAPAGEPGGTRL
nr:hypothetical protein [Actinacidiphila yeochonensis]